MATTAFSGQWGTSGGATQSLASADGWKTLIPDQVFVDTDTINSSGVFTIPATGIYQIKGQFGLNGGSVPGLWHSRILANGSTVLAEGFNNNSTGTDYGHPIAQYFGCLEAGTTIEFQGNNPGASASETYGNIALLRVPQPFTILDMDVGDVDQNIVWQPICDIPAWWDGGQPTRITVPSTGYYLLTQKNDWTGTFTGTFWRVAEVFVNGSWVHQSVGYPGPGSIQWNMPITTILSLTAGDYVEIFNDVQSGASGGVDLLTSADLGMFQFPGTFCGAHIFKSGQVADGTERDVTFNTSVYDTDGFWAGGTSPYLTVPSGKAGTYIVWANDLKAGKRAVYSNLYSTATYVAGDAVDWMITGVDSANLDNNGSSPHFAIWDLAVGDQIRLTIQNFDVGGTQADLNMGLALIDGWTYPRQRGCPCPKPWIPQIYRRLAKASSVTEPAEFVSGLGTVRNFNTGTNYTSETISVPSITIADGESIFVSAGGNSATVNGWACSDNLGNTYTIEKGPTADLGYSIFGPQLVGTLFAAIPSITGVLTSITITWTDALGGDGTRIMLAARFRNIGAQEASTQEDNIGGSYTTANGVLTQAGSAGGIGISCYVQRTAGGVGGVTFSSPATAAIIAAGIGVGSDNSAISVGLGYSQPVTSAGIVANNAGDPSRSYLHIGKAYSAA